jgi:tyrosyl-tRNA synthetase
VQKFFGMKPQNLMTLKMLDGPDGRKMSTSWGNVINILDEPNKMFSKLMEVKDELIYDYFVCCTRVLMKDIKKIKKELDSKKINPKEIKKILAKAIVTEFHSHNLAEAAEKEYEKVFEKKDLPTQIAAITIKEKEINILELLIKLGLSNSKGEARRLVEQGGIKFISDGKIEIKSDWQEMVKIKKGTVIQSGKKNFRKIG